MTESETEENESIANKFESVIKGIEESETNNIKPQLCFCRKYQNSGKANYIFYRANMLDGVSEEVSNILKDNINDLKYKQEVDELDDNLEECYSVIGLDEIANWKKFEDNAFSLSLQRLDDLKKLKSNLNSFIIYYKFDNKIIGQIRRITSSKVLDQKGILRLSFGNNTFNNINNDKDVTIDKYYDFLFLAEFMEEESDEESEEETILIRIVGLGIIDNYDNFCSIFDMNEQFEEEAREVIRTCNIFNSFREPTRIVEMIESDRTLQRTLRRPVCKEAFASIEPQHIIEIKTELGDNVKFYLENDEVILPENNKKEALKEFIRSVGHYYNKSIYGEHRIVEGKPFRVL